MVISRISPLSAAKIAGLMYALAGLPFALLIWLVSLVGLGNSGLFGSPFGPGAGLVAGAGAAAIVILPLIYGVAGFLMTLIAASLYNLMAAQVGGLRIEVREEAVSDLSGHTLRHSLSD